MGKKWIFLMFVMLLLCGCGASADDAPEAMAVNGSATEAKEIAPKNFSQNSIADTVPAAAEAPEAYAETRAEAPMEDMGEAAEYSQQQYFTFDVMTNSIADEQGTELLFELYCDASFHADNPKLEEWVNSVLDQIHQQYLTNSNNLIEYAKEDQGRLGKEFYSYSNYLVLGVARHDNAVASLLSLSSVYSGGAYPNSTQTAYNMDILGERLLTLEDVILEQGAGELYELVLAGVEEKFSAVGDGALFEDYEYAVSTAMTYGNLTPYWYFNNDGLVIFFNQYELGPHAAGIIKVELDYGRLEGILAPEYFPENTCSAGGDLTVCEDASGLETISVTIEDGDKICVGVEGSVYQVQLSEIIWLNETPVYKRMIFSANFLERTDALEIIGGFTDEERSFAIEYSDGTEETKVYYVHEDGLSEEP